MRRYLKFALKPHWKMIILIMILSVFQIYFQLETISLFKTALTHVKQQNVSSLIDTGILMMGYTILSIVFMATISVLTTNVSSSCAYETRRNIFHILMHAPPEKVSKFKQTSLISRAIRGAYTEQRFIELLLKKVLLVPLVIAGITIQIAFIDTDFTIGFIAVLAIITLLLIFKTKEVTDIYFIAKNSFGKINSGFMERINQIKNNDKSDLNNESFEKTCKDSYDKDLKYQLSQYWITPVLFLVLNGIVVLLLLMVCSGFSITSDIIGYTESVVIIQYVLYLITTLGFIPTLIYRFPKAYTTAVRIEEVLVLEDEIDDKLESEELEIKDFEFEDVDLDDPQIMNTHIKDRISIARKIKFLIKDYRLKIIVSLILLSIATLCITYAPKVAGKIVNSLAKGDGFDGNMINSILILFVLYVIGYVLKAYSNRIMIFVGEKTAYDLRIQMHAHLANSKIFSKYSDGDILGRMNNDLYNVKDFITMRITSISSQILSIIFIIILSLTTDWRLSLIYMVVVPIYIVALYIHDIKSKKSYDVHQNLLGKLMDLVNMGLNNHDDIYSKSRQKEVEESFDKPNCEARDKYVSTRYSSGLIQPITTLILNFSNIALYIFGIYFLITNEIQIGTLLTVIMYGKLLAGPIKKLGNSFTSMETSFSSIKRISDIFEEMK